MYRSRLLHSRGKEERAPAGGSSTSSPLRSSGPSSSLTILLGVLRLNGSQLPLYRIHRAGRSGQLNYNKRPREITSQPLLIPGELLVISRTTRNAPRTAGSACPRYHKKIKPDKHQYKIFHQIQDGIAAPPFLLLLFLLKFLMFPCFRLKIRRNRVDSVRGPRRRVRLAEPAAALGARFHLVRLFSAFMIRTLLCQMMRIARTAMSMA